MNKKPNANADRFTNMPKNKHKLKKPTSFTKQASKNSTSLKMIEASV